MVKVSPRKDVPFRALLTYHMFKKTGVMPEGECFDAEYFQKAPTYVTASDGAKAVFNKDLAEDKKGDVDPRVRRRIASDAALNYDRINDDPAKAFSENVTYDTPDLKMVSHEPEDKLVVWNPTNAKGEFGSAKDIYEKEFSMDKVRDVYKDEDIRNKDNAYYKLISDFVKEHGIEETIKRLNLSRNL